MYPSSLLSAEYMKYGHCPVHFWLRKGLETLPVVSSPFDLKASVCQSAQDIQPCHPGPPGDPAEQCDGCPSAKAVNNLQQQSKGQQDRQHQQTLDT
ncbi:hypothetical protein DPX16_16551 [Anabarilius grahami]|uniref:Uncharacterized protein n=1 Tax=Anabarilius grahami TaxID=495550 RepID=A0A3N0XVM8_ANAGA|nr:hypothetical protein DPX16_16551 [Anabarilius grahami]